MNSATYAFVLNGSDWRKAVEDDWDISVVEVPDQVQIIGHKKIDGVICKIIKLEGGQIIALSK